MPGVSDKLVDDIPSREVTNLFELYYDDNKKYGGELYDSLDTKLKIFQDYCTKVGIHETQYHHAFSTMLKGRAIDFYYETIALENFTFLQMVTLTKNHFETEAYRQLYITEWKYTTFRSLLNDNENTSKS
ncbi:hypothetical protein K3495_g5047 [Podosphaera aphanis]|nr:hypothetical protein K3495_g5047 [Podosphaera aphanis]